jgi:ribosomal protein S18 acetylase RimI-like enzyme
VPSLGHSLGRKPGDPPETGKSAAGKLRKWSPSGRPPRPTRPPSPRSGPTAGELYAIYVHPAYWGGQAGWQLLTGIVSRAAAQRYASLSLWVLETNDRARRFYERAGFAVTGESQVLGDLGGVTEIRYWRPLAG